MLTIYEASAGSGKTYTLTHQYISMLRKEKGRNRHRRLLAVTFTKKATAEMKERIIQALSEMGQNDADCQRMLIELLQDYSAFAVNTIDSFFQQIVRSFQKELNLTGGYNVELDAENIRRMAVDDMFFSLPTDTKDNASKAIKALIDKNIEDGSRWNPREAIFEAAKQLFNEKFQRKQKQIEAYLEEHHDSFEQYKKNLNEKWQLYFSTYRKIADDAKKIIGDPDDDKLYKNATVFNCLKCTKISDILGLIGRKSFATLRKFTENSLTCARDTKNPPASLECVQPLMKQLLNMLTGEPMRDMLTVKTIREQINFLEIYSQLAVQIDRRNHQLGRLPLAQTNGLVAEVIDENEEAPFIYDKIGVRIRHYLIDEFQDTSAMQWHNFRPLLKESLAYGNTNLIVGDAKQSIYRWRNSDYHLLSELVEQQIKPNEKKNLATNRRSDINIVKTNNELFPLLLKHIGNEQLNNIYSSVGQEVFQSGEGYVEMNFVDELNTGGEHAPLADTILEAHKRGVPYNKIALLFRYNKEIAMLAPYLMSRGIPVVSSEGLLLCYSPVVLFIVSLLQLQQTPNDKVIRFKALFYEAVLHDYTRNEALRQAFKNGEIGINTERNTSNSLYQTVYQILQQIDLHDSQTHRAYADAFLDTVWRFENKYSSDTAAFLDWWEQTGSKKTSISLTQTDAVEMLTIHKSKGLQFDVVMMPYVDWPLGIKTDELIWVKPQPPYDDGGKLPLIPIALSQRLADTAFKQDYEREVTDCYVDNLNLLYVALTRARHELYLWAEAPATNKDGSQTEKNIGHTIYATCLENEWITKDKPYIERGAKLTDFYPQPAEQDTVAEQTDTLTCPIGDRLKIKWFARQMQTTNNNDNQMLHLGRIMHDILSKVYYKGDEAKLVAQMLRTGELEEEQEQLVAIEMAKFWQLVKPTDWFSEEYTVLTEQDILLPNGDIKRPDRVMIKGQNAIVVDYKFGRMLKTEEYTAQVLEYCRLLEQMGYHTEGYLCYVTLGKIVKV